MEIFGDPLYLSFQRIMSLLQSVFEGAVLELSRPDGPREQVLASLYNDTQFHIYLAVSHSNHIETEMYYQIANDVNIPMRIAIVQPAPIALSSNSPVGWFTALKENGRTQGFFAANLVISIISLLVLGLVVIPKVSATLRVFHNTCLLLPWKLLYQNPLLSHHFNK